jgi:5-methylcytosine-specific restriction endonuclease McrA
MGVRTWQRPSDAVTRTRRWRALRLEALRRDGFRCQDCGARGRLEVHHVRSVREAPELGFDLANLKSLCPSCHVRETRRELGQAPTTPQRAAWRAAVRSLARTPITAEEESSVAR